MATIESIKLLQKKRLLELSFSDASHFELTLEYLRVYSPSAEVRGHGNGPRKWPEGKALVNVVGIDPVGNYAVKLIFDDGHDSGIYSFDYLHELGKTYEEKWQAYLAAMTEQGLNRQPDQSE